jgi:hypothetical protein
VTFGEGEEYEFRIADSELAGVSVERAQRWFDDEYVRADCEPANPVGKVLLSDKLLGIARAAGPEPFAGQTEWANAFALHAAVLVGRANVTINVPEATVGF